MPVVVEQRIKTPTKRRKLASKETGQPSIKAFFLTARDDDDKKDDGPRWSFGGGAYDEAKMKTTSTVAGEDSAVSSVAAEGSVVSSVDSKDSVISPDGRALYAVVSGALDAVSKTRSRLAKDRALTKAFGLLRECSIDDIEAACYLMAPVRDAQAGGHRLQADYEHRPLALSYRVVVRALVDALGTSADALRKLARAKHGGDFSDAAVASLRARRRPDFFTVKAGESASLNCVTVRDELLSMAGVTGTGSDETKRRKLAGLFRRARGTEVKWLLRTAQAYMSCGISLEASVMPAMAKAFGCSPMACRFAYARRPNVRDVCQVVIAGGDLDDIKIEPGVPPQPMLASPCTSLADAWIKAAKFSPLEEPLWAERKYDGQRLGAHLLPGESVIRLFSRSCDDMTAKYPEACDALRRSAKTKGFVVDAEILAATEDDSPAPFQTLSTKPQRLLVYLFDLLWIDTLQDVRDRPTLERRSLLCSHFDENEVVRFAVGSTITPKDDEALRAALLQAVEAGCEGLVLKHPRAPYEISPTRSNAWLKLKKDYLDDCSAAGDSFDLVPVGGWRGSGRKRKWISPILVATRDDNDGTLGCVCRVMSGFSDQFYREFTRAKLGQEIDENLLETCPNNQKHPSVETSEQCTFWFEPAEVFEIKAADITVSPTHRSAFGLICPDRGLSLRFPRFIRRRIDKSIQEATTPAQLALCYRNQPSALRSPQDVTCTMAQT